MKRRQQRQRSQQKKTVSQIPLLRIVNEIDAQIVSIGGDGTKSVQTSCSKEQKINYLINERNERNEKQNHRHYYQKLETNEKGTGEREMCCIFAALQITCHNFFILLVRNLVWFRALWFSFSLILKLFLFHLMSMFSLGCIFHLCDYFILFLFRCHCLFFLFRTVA